MTTKERLHELIEALPERDLYAVQRYLEFLQAEAGPPRTFADAPDDDEELTREERLALAEGIAAAERGDTVPWDLVKRELGIDR